MTRRVQRCQISAHAGSDQRHRLVEAHSLHHVQLCSDGQVPEITLRQVGDFKADSELTKSLLEEASLPGTRAAGEAVKIDKPAHKPTNATAEPSVKIRRK